MNYGIINIRRIIDFRRTGIGITEIITKFIPVYCYGRRWEIGLMKSNLKAIIAPYVSLKFAKYSGGDRIKKIFSNSKINNRRVGSSCSAAVCGRTRCMGI